MRHQTQHRLPGSHGLPLIGETANLLLDAKFIHRRQKKYGNIFRSHLLGKPTVCMVGPEAAKFVLSTHMDHFAWEPGFPDTFKDLMGRSLFLQDGDEHKRNRQILAPAFHGQALKGYFEIMNATILRHLEHWAEKRELVWYNEHKRLNFDIASQILLGATVGDEVQRLSDLCTVVTEGLYVPIRSKLPGGRFQRAVKARNEVLAHLKKVINQRKKNLTNDALSLLIQARDEHGDWLTLDEIIVQALFLLFAGYETSTSMVTWLCLELARHPDVLARAREEQLLLAQQGPPDYQQLQQMRYLDQVLNEIQRFHPPVLGGFRGAIKDFTFEGHTVPAGTNVYLSFMETHRDPSVYTKPDTFDPERFNPDREEHKNKPFSLIGFGGGPRICLGMNFAQMEIKLVMAHLLRGYQWELIPGQRLNKVLFPAPVPKDLLQVYLYHWHGKAA